MFLAKLIMKYMYMYQCIYIYFFLILGDVLLHLATRSGNERAGIFLAKNGARLNLTNNKVTCYNGCSMRGILSKIDVTLLRIVMVSVVV
jgi:hypothetical protein